MSFKNQGNRALREYALTCEFMQQRQRSHFTSVPGEREHKWRAQGAGRLRNAETDKPQVQITSNRLQPALKSDIHSTEDNFTSGRTSWGRQFLLNLDHDNWSILYLTNTDILDMRLFCNHFNLLICRSHSFYLHLQRDEMCWALIWENKPVCIVHNELALVRKEVIFRNVVTSAHIICVVSVTRPCVWNYKVS